LATIREYNNSVSGTMVVFTKDAQGNNFKVKSRRARRETDERVTGGLEQKDDSCFGKM
jgi:hypothetical protein